jgi:ribonuclease VapC
MVIDTSAILAVLFDEPDQPLYKKAIAASAVPLLSAVTRVELSLVIEGRKGGPGDSASTGFWS